jgi:hypothetical protein
VLKNEYDITDMGPIRYCLGWEIIRDRTQRSLSINQKQYIHNILQRFNMSDCCSVPTPAVDNIIWDKSMCPTSKKERESMKSKPYMELLGSLMYAATSTRPDIALALSELSRYANNPGLKHWEGLKRVLRYLKGTANYGITYSPSGRGLFGYVDANHARCPDTRRSRYGGILMMNNGPVDWKSKMESIVALSSMEAEYIGACEIVRLIAWMRQCLKELNKDNEGPVELMIDNKSAKILAEEYMIQNKSKHIDTKYHYIREQVISNLIQLIYQPSSQMPADALTKPLGPKLFNRFRDMMGVKPIVQLGGVCQDIQRYNTTTTEQRETCESSRN